jgi:hypothetical protein
MDILTVFLIAVVLGTLGFNELAATLIVLASFHGLVKLVKNKTLTLSFWLISWAALLLAFTPDAQKDISFFILIGTLLLCLGLFLKKPLLYLVKNPKRNFQSIKPSAPPVSKSYDVQPQLKPEPQNDVIPQTPRILN